jgi:hypothetical protein
VTVNKLGHDLQTVPAKERTCLEDGYSEYQKCSRCDYKTAHETSSAYGSHNIVTHDAQDPTCTEVGWYAYETCFREGCGYSTYEGKERAALDHDYTNGVETVVKKATCKEKGTKTIKCIRCDEKKTEEIAINPDAHTYAESWTSVDENSHCHVCTGCGAKSEKVAHNLTTTTTNATCTEAGEKVTKCSDCDYEKEEIIPKTGHDWDTDKWTSDSTGHWHACTHTNCTEKNDFSSHTEGTKIETPATCTTVGESITKCKVCDCEISKAEISALGHSCTEGVWNTTDDTYHWQDCARCNEQVSKAEHSWTLDESASKAATATAGGYNKYKCTCGKEKTVTIPAKGEWKSDETNHWHGTGDNITDKAAHVWDSGVTKTATCTEDGGTTYTCSVCGKTKTDTITKAGHTYVYINTDSSKHWEKCTKCNAIKENSETKHTFTVKTGSKVDATCTVDGTEILVCECGYEKTETLTATGHTAQEVIKSEYLVTAATCTTKAVYHKTCSACNAVLADTFEGEALGHDLKNHEAKTPTCTEVGWDAYDTCSRCDYTTYVEKAALGHDLVNHEAKAPTCTAIGWDAYDTCSRCDYTTYVEKAALGHLLNSHVSAQDSTCTEKGWNAYDVCGRDGCDYTTKVEIEALGHSYNNAWTTDDDNHWHKCIRCGAKSNDAKHNWNDGVFSYNSETSCDGIKTFTCQTCGITKYEAAYFDHNYVNYRCSRCQIWGPGPSGGYVFYDCDADNEKDAEGNETAGVDGLMSSVCGWRFLEAAPADIKDSNNYLPIFGAYIPDGQTEFQPVGKTKDGIGDGKTNTEELVFAMGLNGEYAYNNANSNVSGIKPTDQYAALLCYKYIYINTETNESFGDWFLPSIEELKLIMANLNKFGLGNLYYDSRNYWSSTEADSASSSDIVKIVCTQGYKADATETVHIKYGTNGGAYLRPIRAFSLCSDNTPNHTWNSGVTTEATCTERGKITYTCTKCNATKVETIKELGHSWDEGKVTEPATCTNKGTKTYTCSNSNCSETKTEEISVDPSYHPYENYKCKDCGIWGKGPSGGYVFYDCDADNVTENGVVTEGPDGLMSSVCGWRFLEAAPTDATVDIDGTSTSLFIFGCYAKEVEASLSNAGTETGIGTGLANTEKLVKAMGRNALDYSNSIVAAGKTANYAAKVALDYSVTNNGVEYNDWFLPSKEELETLISNIGLCKNKAGESVKLDSSLDPQYMTTHWSSSENTASTDTGNSAYYVQLYYSSSTNTYSRNKESHVRPIRAFSLCSDGVSEHKWEVTSTTEATCTENGTKTYTCSVCSATKTETLVALGHEYKNYKCTNCEAWGRGPAGGWVFYDAGKDITSTYTDMNGNTKTYTWRYLEAAPEDCSYTKDGTTCYEYAFGYYRQNASINPSSGSGANLPVDTKTDIGTGRNNTGLLLYKMGREYTYVSLPSGKTQYSTGKHAAGATYVDSRTTSNLYTVTNPVTKVSYTDWFLPSRDELALMSQNLRENDLGNLRNGNVYWSSSEVDADNAYSVYFSDQVNNYTTPDTRARSTAFRVRPVRAFTDTETTTSN